MIFLLILIIGTATGYDLKCPAKAEWRFKGNISCSSEDKYVCLFNLLEEKHMENCLGLDLSRIGSKLVLQPLFNLAECDTGRYQPIVFTTHGNSECIFSKSMCADEGQLVFSNDSSRADTACRCDYTQGYAFVTRPTNRCFCYPSDEDCSCFRSTCTKLSADYKCVTDREIMVNSTCQEILPNIPYNTDENTTQLTEGNIKGYSSAHHVAYIIIASIVVYFVVAVVVLLKVSDFGKLQRHPTYRRKKSNLVTGAISIPIDENETIDEDVRQPNETTDDERQKFIHELFLKGESGKLHFARLVFIGKHGVGKTSLMKRLLWHNKEDVTSTQSTDGIEVEKCNINIADGKWSPCNETDDDVRRLIRQVFKGKMLNKERKSIATVDDHEPLSSNEDESRSESDFFTSSDENHDIDSFNDDSQSGSDEYAVDIQTLVLADDKNDHATADTGLNEMQPDNCRLKKMVDSKINNYSTENESDLLNDENINKMTSTIMNSFLQSPTEKHDDMLAFCWLWDFAGQKDFYATHQVFLSKCAVYVLVTNSLEFSSVANQGLDVEGSAQYVSFWFDAIHCYWSTTKNGTLHPPIIVVCTHEDQIKEPLERKKRQEQFKENLGQVMKDQKKKGHLKNLYFVSNTEDTDIVFEEIRKDISRQAMDMQDWGKDCPLKWLLFQEVLLKLKDSSVPISSTETLLKIAKHPDINISEDYEVKRCLQYCHDIGTVVYFDEEKLADYVILDPKWLVNAFRCLVSDKIENVIEVSDDWQKLKNFGQLTEALISSLFKKEPELQFEENKPHLLEVMKRFDIIVNLKNSTELYMPCMIKSCSFPEVKRQFSYGSQSTKKTSWLCLEFKFLPPAFFNHIIAWYIKQYNVSVILDKTNRRKRNALFRQVGVFDLDSSGCEQLVVCEGPNTIALQVWDSRMSNKTYGKLRSELFRFVKTLRKRYSLHIPYSNTLTCKNGDFAINRKTLRDLLTTDYRCLEHNTNHSSHDLVKPWDLSEELESERYRKQCEEYHTYREQLNEERKAGNYEREIAWTMGDYFRRREAREAAKAAEED